MRQPRQWRRQNEDDAKLSAGRRRRQGEQKKQPARGSVAPTKADTTTSLHLALRHLCAGSAIAVHLHLIDTAPTTTPRMVHTGDRATIITLMVAGFTTARDRPVDVTSTDVHICRHTELCPLINMMMTSVRVNVSGTGSGGIETQCDRCRGVGCGTWMSKRLA